MDPQTSFFSVYIEIVILLAFIAFNAFLSVLEVSISKLKKMQDDDIKENKFFEKMVDNTEYYLSVMQFLKLFTIILTSNYIYKAFLFRFKDLFSYIGIKYSSAFSIIILSLIVACLILSLTEIIPKKIAFYNMKRPCFYRFIYMVSKIVFPILSLVSIFNNLILKIFHSNLKEFDEKVSEEEIKALVETASEKGVFNDIEKEMINSIFSFDDIMAKDIMVSRKDTYKIDIDEPFTSKIDEILESYYSRIPVYRQDIDDIIGILNVKDLTLEARKIGFENVKLENLLQEPYFVPEMKSIDELFKEMQKSRNHMAILVDEYGGFSGIVTIEDMIEQIMGDINDEFDDEDISIQQVSQNVYAINGTTEIREINKELDLNLENENYDTISALIIEKIGYIPDESEKPSLKIDNLLFKVELVSDNRIEKLKLIIRPLEENIE